MKKAMLTTFDNPFDPFEDFENWYLFDMNKQYNSCSMLARIAKYDDEMSEEEKDAETERAIDEIVAMDFLKLYKKVEKEDDTVPITSY